MGIYVGKNGSTVLTMIGRLTAYAGVGKDGYPALFVQLRTKTHSQNILKVSFDELDDELHIDFLSNKTWKLTDEKTYRKDDLLV
jgi:hypothetical protein